MALRDQIEEIVNSMTSNNGYAPSFCFGTQHELNLLADDTAFPVVFMYALKPITFGRTNSPAINNSYSIYLEFLDITEFDQFTSQNEAIINQQILAANEFLLRLEQYRQDGVRRYFKTSKKDVYKGLPVYNKFDVNSTGISMSLDLKTMYNEIPAGLCMQNVFLYGN